MVAKVDLNCDMGESFGLYNMGDDGEVIKHITSANIACGFHAGDPVWMRKTVDLAEENNVAIGAHPSYPDLNGFGRRNMQMDPKELKDIIIYQIGALIAFTKSKNIQHVKPHGAMYNQAVSDPIIAKAICEALLEFDRDLILLALSGSIWVDIAAEMGLKVGREVFADRGFNSDGTLVPRSKSGAVIQDIDEVVDRSLRMIIENKVVSVNGDVIDIEADSLCLHGDTPGAVNMARKLKSELISNQVALVNLSESLQE